jgi:hypothetical protein
MAWHEEFVNSLLNPILNNTKEYELYIGRQIAPINELVDKIKKYKPNELRQNYDKLFDDITSAEKRFNTQLRKIETSIERLKNSKNTIKHVIFPEYEKIKVLLNKNKIGTLHGQALQTIEKNKIKSSVTHVQSIIDQPYDEATRMLINQSYEDTRMLIDKPNSEDASIGGGKTKRKRKRRYFSKKNRR